MTAEAVAGSCVTYPLALAIEDIVPIVLAGIGYWFLIKRTRSSVPAVAPAMQVAAVLLVLGSVLAGPVRKILAFANQVPICAPDFEVPYSWCQIPFVVALAPGFAILAWGVISVLRERKVVFWPAIGLLALGVMAAVATDRRPILFAWGGLAAAVLAVAAAVLARRQRDFLAVGLFALYLVGTLALPVISNKGNVSQPEVQWLAQGINTTIQLAFLIASYRLSSVFRRRTVDSAVNTV